MSTLWTLPQAKVTLKRVPGHWGNQLIVTHPELPAVSLYEGGPKEHSVIMCRGDLTHSRVQTRNRGGVINLLHTHMVVVGIKRLRTLFRAELTKAQYNRLINA